MSRYYDRDGKPLSAKAWAETGKGDYHRVAADVLPNGYWVSTVWLGLDHSFGEGEPLIFETMVFPCDAEGRVTDWGDKDCERYSTEAAAKAGHAAMVAKWAAVIADSEAR